MNQKIEKHVMHMAEIHVAKVDQAMRRMGVSQYYMAGNCLNSEEVEDIDLFPVGEPDEKWNMADIGEILSVTDNARTYKVDGHIVQLCKYAYNTLPRLVCSFDFAHIQCGVHVVEGEVVELFVTTEYLLAQTEKDSWYVSSDYPLASLMRILKYHRRGQISEVKAKQSIYHMLADIARRGYLDADDFIEQANGVDPRDDEDEVENAWEYYEAMMER